MDGGAFAKQETGAPGPGAAPIAPRRGLLRRTFRWSARRLLAAGHALRSFLRSFWRSGLTRRVLAINLLALLIPLAGFLYLGEYRRALLDTELRNLTVEAETAAAALGASAVISGDQFEYLLPDTTTQLLRRMLWEERQARLFGADGELIVDTRRLGASARAVTVEPLPVPSERPWFIESLLEAYDRMVDRWSALPSDLPYVDPESRRAEAYPEAMQALNGDSVSVTHPDAGGGRVLVVAVPVQRYRKVLGALMLTADDGAVDYAVSRARQNLLRISGLGLLGTVLLSLFLAGTITQPIQRLAAAAERVRRGQVRAPGPGRRSALESGGGIPDFTARRDEIGDLSLALREMTEAMWQRMAATERFAADVAHELKNPLSSLRSAVETFDRQAERPDEPGARARAQRLMQIIVEDVHRLDRLISDISNYSRLEAEMSREETEPVDLGAMVQLLAEISEMTGDDPDAARAAPVRVAAAAQKTLVPGRGDRLMQVLRNLVDNAQSFSPPGGSIRISVAAADGWATVAVEDDGPGIPEGKLEAIFERFYSERPNTTKFKNHSGLGLAISRQIVEAHGGRIWAENRPPAGSGASGPAGARFVMRLPLA
ncbi:MAG: sensor N-terminal transmembrane domain-containing protein [Alphaproteobacteria bacterium]|nr:sensor N-terminal transmembrane domain-containing protein [Alphaproteobacteria bacterium]